MDPNPADPVAADAGASSDGASESRSNLSSSALIPGGSRSVARGLRDDVDSSDGDHEDDSEDEGELAGERDLEETGRVEWPSSALVVLEAAAAAAAASRSRCCCRCLARHRCRPAALPLLLLRLPVAAPGAPSPPLLALLFCLLMAARRLDPREKNPSASLWPALPGALALPSSLAFHVRTVTAGASLFLRGDMAGMAGR